MKTLEEREKKLRWQVADLIHYLGVDIKDGEIKSKGLAANNGSIIEDIGTIMRAIADRGEIDQNWVTENPQYRAVILSILKEDDRFLLLDFSSMVNLACRMIGNRGSIKKAIDVILDSKS